MSSSAQQLQTTYPDNGASNATPGRKSFICRMISVVFKSISFTIDSFNGDNHVGQVVSFGQKCVAELTMIFNRVSSEGPKKVLIYYKDVALQEITKVVQSTTGMVLPNSPEEKPKEQDVKPVPDRTSLTDIPVVGIIPKGIQSFESIVRSILGKGKNYKNKNYLAKPSTSKQSDVGNTEPFTVINQTKEAILPENILSTISKILSRK